MDLRVLLCAFGMLLASAVVESQRRTGPDFGTRISTFRSFAHNVGGDVYAIDDDTFFIKGFRFDGMAPETYFWAGSGPQPSAQGFRVPDEFGREDQLKRYDGKDITISLPPGKKIRDISWLSVWSRKQSANLGDVMIPPNFQAPQPRPISRLGGGSGRGGVRSSDVTIIDSKTILIPQFNYDGSLQETYFLVGTGNPSSQGTKIPDERGMVQNLRAYNSEDVRIMLPNELTIKDIDWIAVWNFVSNENLGSVSIPSNLSVPPQIHGTNQGGIGGFTSGSQYGTQYPGQQGQPGQPGGSYGGSQGGQQYGSSGSGQYGGSGGQYGGSGGQYGGSGTGTGTGAGQYGGSGSGGQYPGGQYGPSTQYGPGSQYPGQPYGTGSQYPGQGGQQGGYGGQGSYQTQFGTGIDNFTTCEEFFNGKVQVSWKLMGQNILLRMAGQLNDNEYMAFGISGSPVGSQMIGGDVVVVYQDGFRTVLKDYYLDSQTRCDGRTGACPDITLGGQEDIRTVSALRQNGVTVATYERPLTTSDRYDKPYLAFGDTFVIAAVGPVLNGEIDKHTQSTRENQRIDFSREGVRNCRVSLASQIGGVQGGQYGGGQYGGQTGGGQYGGQYGGTGSGTGYSGSGTYGSGGGTYGGASGSGGSYGSGSGTYTPYGSGGTAYGGQQGGFGSGWFIQPIEREMEIRCQIGPAGGEKGYTAITGKQSWGQAWWCNEKLIPEIVVTRGQTYTFNIEGGDDPTNQAKYNPFYITSSEVGGYGELQAEERTREKIFAGVSTDYRGVVRPTSSGRYCEWRSRTFDGAQNFNSFEEYKRTLEVTCDDGIPARLVWIPDDGTPDVVYYQSYSHKNYGWRIRVQGHAGFIRSGATSAHTTLSCVLATVMAALAAYLTLRQ